jgi:hypothetical protein
MFSTLQGATGGRKCGWWWGSGRPIANVGLRKPAEMAREAQDWEGGAGTCKFRQQNNGEDLWASGPRTGKESPGLEILSMVDSTLWAIHLWKVRLGAATMTAVLQVYIDTCAGS